MTFHEVKPANKDGKVYARDDAMVKLKVAADRHPYRFFLASRTPIRDGGVWKVVEC